VELQLALIGIGNAVSLEKMGLQRRTELSKAVPRYRQILVAISNPDPPRVDATNDLALMDEEIVEGEIAMGYHRIGRKRQKLLHRAPDLFGGPALALLIELLDLYKARIDPHPGAVQPKAHDGC